MPSSTKNTIRNGLVLAAILCLVSFPGLPISSAMEPMCFQSFNGSAGSQSDFAISAFPSDLSTPAGRSINISILATSLGRFNGTISLSTSLPISWSSNFDLSSLSLKNGNCNWTKLTVSIPSDAPIGTHRIEVAGTNGSVIRSANVTVNVVEPDFMLCTHPSTLRMLAGSSVNTTIGVFSLYRFNGTVSLTAISPTGWPASSFALTSLSTKSNEGNSTTLSISAPSSVMPGRYVVKVTGVSASLSHSINVTVQVVAPDFNIYAFPSCIDILAGSSKNITIIVNPVNRFNGTVSLTAEYPAGITSNPPVPLSVEIKYNASSSSTLNITVPSTTAVGKYVITVTGSSGGLTHKVNVTVQVVRPEFSVYTFTSSLSVHAGSAKNVTLMVSPLNGFTGTVTLSLSAPAGWTSTVLARTSLTINGRSNSTTLSVVVPPTAATGNYILTVTGTSGSLTNSTSLTITVK